MTDNYCVIMGGGIGSRFWPFSRESYPKQFLDFFDFLTNSVMMPIAAFTTCLLVSKVIGVKKIEEEVLHGEGTFRRKKIFNFDRIASLS